ncbi:MAG: acetyl-CoA carboxylase biotin carboxyl carrier protein [Candidatus Rokuibacteriota bacterium]
MARSRARAGPDERAVVELTRQLGGLLAELGLGEIEVAVGELRIRLVKPALLPAPLPSAPPSSSRSEPPSEAVTRRGITVESPMVGTFYRASSPTAEPYVSEGDVVKEGQILCIIEAMKLMNEIEAKTAGRIVTILVENAQPVEYGQALFLIEPAW